jgi:putative component of membrane protein insertase Oxa1/YidC/SpoIIIJ protein YidD
MQISLVDSLSRQVGVAAITGYQKHISPHKGFICAHRVLCGGESCSQYIKRVVAQDGFQAAFVKSRERFQACKQANQILHAAKRQPRRSQSEEEQEESDTPPPKKAPYISGDHTSCVDCADVGRNLAEVVGVIPDCGSFDCSAANCHSLDCSGVDCGALDCGFLDCGGCGG